MKREGKSIKKAILIALLLTGGIIMVWPFLWMILTSFKTEAEAMKIPITLFPENATVENYVTLFTKMKFLTYLKNTMIIVVFSFIGLFMNALAGYAFAKYEFPFKKGLFVIVLATMMIPSQITMIPIYLILNFLGLTNTMTGIVLPGLVGAFGIFLFRQFMESIPSELIEAFRIDGAGEFRTFFQLILPVSKSIFAVQGIMTFIGAWNSFLWPLIIANDERYYTLSVGLSLLKGQNSSDFALQMAGAAVMVVPILIIFSIFQKQIMEGITITGMK